MSPHLSHLESLVQPSSFCYYAETGGLYSLNFSVKLIKCDVDNSMSIFDADFSNFQTVYPFFLVHRKMELALVNARPGLQKVVVAFSSRSHQSKVCLRAVFVAQITDRRTFHNFQRNSLIFPNNMKWVDLWISRFWNSGTLGHILGLAFLLPGLTKHFTIPEPPGGISRFL